MVVNFNAWELHWHGMKLYLGVWTSTFRYARSLKLLGKARYISASFVYRLLIINCKCIFKEYRLRTKSTMLSFWRFSDHFDVMMQRGKPGIWHPWKKQLFHNPYILLGVYLAWWFSTPIWGWINIRQFWENSRLKKVRIYGTEYPVGGEPCLYPVNLNQLLFDL